jgi:tetratricopeptide (TPR) repeat protein
MDNTGHEPSMLVDGRFRLAHLMKNSSGVETWRGEDLAGGSEVAVKMLAAARVPTVVRTRLQHEARVLQGLHGPAVTPLIAASESNGSFYLVVPWVEGQTLEERLRHGPLPVEEALQVSSCVLQALAEAHEAGVLHRDIKPSNIVVHGDGQNQTAAALIDFGLARSVELDTSLRDEPVGTVEYVSPEQAGLISREVDGRSDLYSLGVVLYECLAGHAPFEGQSVSEILRAHASAVPPALPETVPRALDEVVHRLLQKEPRDRYQSVHGVLADLQRIREAIESGASEPNVVIGLEDERQSLAEPAFVGRRHELARLENELENARRGLGSIVLLEAESGVGKTRLLDELDARCRRVAWVLRGQALAEVAQQPFELFVGVVRGILAASRADPAWGMILRERLGARREAVCVALPDLVEILGPPPGDVLGPESLGEMRTIDALVTLIESLGSPSRPAVLLLDDCQWADESALKLLLQFQQRLTGMEGRPPCNVLIVASFRTEEVAEGHPLRVMPQAARMTLPTLLPAEVRALVESMAGALPDQAVNVVEELSVGSPFMATAVLRGMVESGALVAEQGAFRVEPLGLHDVRSSGQAAVFLSRRLARLPFATRRILSVGALLGREFDLELAAALAEVPLRDAMTAVTLARHRGILWTRSGGTRSVFVHDKLREALLAGLTPSERKRLHFQAAVKTEATDPGRAFDISYHYDSAGAPERALAYALTAADLARSRHALAVAEEQYLIARRGSTALPGHETALEQIRMRVAEGLGDVLMLRGRYDGAVAEFEFAQTLARGPLDQARLHGKMSELAFKRGNMDAAGRSVEQGLAVLRRTALRGRWPVLAGLLLEVFVQVLHVLFPRIFVGRRRIAGAEEEFLAIHLYSRLAHISWFQRGNLATLWAHLREMNLAERYPPTAHLAQAYSEHAPVMTMLPWYSRGQTYALRSYEIRKALGDVWGQGQSLHFLGVVLYSGSRFEECMQSCTRALRLLERTGDRWEINTALPLRPSSTARPPIEWCPSGRASPCVPSPRPERT